MQTFLSEEIFIIILMQTKYGLMNIKTLNFVSGYEVKKENSPTDGSYKKRNLENRNIGIS